MGGGSSRSNPIRLFVKPIRLLKMIDAYLSAMLAWIEFMMVEVG